MYTILVSLNITKGEEFEWSVEDKNLLLLERVEKTDKKKFKNKKNKKHIDI